MLFACKQTPHDAALDDPSQASVRVRSLVVSCEGVTRVLDALARSKQSGRDLSGLVDEALATATCSDVRNAIKGTAVAHQLARARIDDAKPEAALAALTATTDPAIRYRRAELFDRMGK